MLWLFTFKASKDGKQEILHWAIAGLDYKEALDNLANEAYDLGWSIVEIETIEPVNMGWQRW
jgi:hypothetical protein